MIEQQSGTHGRLRLSPNLSSTDAKTGEMAGASLPSLAPHPFWNDTPIPQWSEEDAKQLLADSPWVKKVQLDIVRNLSMFERRDGGDLNAGIPSGFGLATAGLWADWREVEALEHAHALESLGTVVVRWESAFPVRGAALKVGETDVPGWVGDYVHDRMNWLLTWRESRRLWGRLLICGRLAIGLPGFALTARRITNPLQVTNLPHIWKRT